MAILIKCAHELLKKQEEDHKNGRISVVDRLIK